MLRLFFLGSRLPDFHRRVLIFPPFAGSALGLLVITLMFVIDWRQQRRTHGNVCVQVHEHTEYSYMHTQTLFSNFIRVANFDRCH